MKNDFDIRGDMTVIFLKQRSGRIIETVISTDDLPEVQAFPNTWLARWSKYTNSFYVIGASPRNGGKQRTVLLHRWILDPPKDLVVDHINHDTLDNRRENLRAVTQAQNCQNLAGLRKDNRSGFRGVSWDKESQKWRADIKINGKRKFLGRFDDVLKANAAMREARAKFMPFSQEKI